MARPRFGYALPIFACPGEALFRTPAYPALDSQRTLALGQLADDLGFDSAWVADHLMLGVDDAILEGWTTLSVLAGLTTDIRLGMIHMSNAFRNPALSAKMAATLDQLSGGRLIHFLDIGHGAAEHPAYGFEWSDDPAERIAAMVEGTELILALWEADEPVTRRGGRYEVVGARCSPRPLQQPHPPLWFGEPFAEMLEATARFGNGWNTVPVTIPELRRRLALLRAAMERHGRSIDDLEISMEMQVLVAPDRAALREHLGGMLDLAAVTGDRTPEIARRIGRRPDHDAIVAFIEGRADDVPRSLREEWMIGTPDEVEARIREYVAEGVGHFLFWFLDAPDDAGMRLFARDVMPRFAAG